jgi:DNA repair protein RadC
MMKEQQNDKKLPHYCGHRQRLKEKFLLSPDALGDYELIELLLTYAIPRKDVKPLAKTLLTHFKDIQSILNADIEALLEVRGLSRNSALLIKLIHELESKSMALKFTSKYSLNSPDEVIEFARKKLASLKHEAFMVIYLNSRNKVETYEIINEGTVNKVVIYPRNLIKNALKNNASAIILIHNHPSGECEPSASDIHLTGLISKAASVMDMKLLDHIIVTSHDSFSFANEQIL